MSTAKAKAEIRERLGAITPAQIAAIARATKTLTPEGSPLYVYIDGFCGDENTPHPQDLDIVLSFSEPKTKAQVERLLTARIASHPERVRLNPGTNFRLSGVRRSRPIRRMTPIEFLMMCYPDSLRIVAPAKAAKKRKVSA
jgi:hypothetical protein